MGPRISLWRCDDVVKLDATFHPFGTGHDQPPWQCRAALYLSGQFRKNVSSSPTPRGTAKAPSKVASAAWAISRDVGRPGRSRLGSRRRGNAYGADTMLDVLRKAPGV